MLYTVCGAAAEAASTLECRTALAAAVSMCSRVCCNGRSLFAPTGCLLSNVPAVHCSCRSTASTAAKLLLVFFAYTAAVASHAACQSLCLPDCHGSLARPHTRKETRLHHRSQEDCSVGSVCSWASRPPHTAHAEAPATTHHSYAPAVSRNGCSCSSMLGAI